MHTTSSSSSRPSAAATAIRLTLTFVLIAFSIVIVVVSNNNNSRRHHSKSSLSSRRKLDQDEDFFPEEITDLWNDFFGDDDEDGEDDEEDADDEEESTLDSFTDGFREIFCNVPILGENCEETEEEQAANGCASVQPLSADQFDLERYTAATWYVQKQQINPYQPSNQLYCVASTYNIIYEDEDDEDTEEEDIEEEEEEEKPEGDTETITILATQQESAPTSPRVIDTIEVQNYANNDAVNGEVTISDVQNAIWGGICAEQVEVEDEETGETSISNGGEFAIGPCRLPSPLWDLVAGPYWVIAIDQENYNWAIVSGGPPDQVRETVTTTNEVDGTTSTTNLCSTTVSESIWDINNSGLWLFTRNQTTTQEIIDEMELTLLNMGIYTGDLLPVQQEGCLYDGLQRKTIVPPEPELEENQQEEEEQDVQPEQEEDQDQQDVP